MEKLCIVIDSMSDWVECCIELYRHGYYWANPGNSDIDRYGCVLGVNGCVYIVIHIDNDDSKQLYYGHKDLSRLNNYVMYNGLDLCIYLEGLRMGLL